MLQNNPLVVAIRKALTNRVLGELKTLAEKNPDQYSKVWKAFGAVLKEGLYEDAERRDALYELLRFHSTASGESSRTLKDYVASLRPNQTAIYYLVGESLDQLKASPQLEGFRARGVEVMLLTDPVDNFWVRSALGYEGKPLKSITQGDAGLEAIDLVEGARPAAGALASPALIGELKKTYGNAVSDVRASTRLVDSPACLVASEKGPDRGLEKILARQDDRSVSSPILEINPGHRLVARLESTRGREAATFDDLAWLLLDEAKILEGGAPGDPAKFAERLNRLLTVGA
jgi:molecular chaperone HtpG